MPGLAEIGDREGLLRGELALRRAGEARGRHRGIAREAHGLEVRAVVRGDRRDPADAPELEAQRDLVRRERLLQQELVEAVPRAEIQAVAVQCGPCREERDGAEDAALEADLRALPAAVRVERVALTQHRLLHHPGGEEREDETQHGGNGAANGAQPSARPRGYIKPAKAKECADGDRRSVRRRRRGGRARQHGARSARGPGRRGLRDGTGHAVGRSRALRLRGPAGASGQAPHPFRQQGRDRGRSPRAASRGARRRPASRAA